ncbi:MAG: tRNA epoxyqueuosine(34) reductase QueG [bacterium]
MDKLAITNLIKGKAQELGFSFCGVARADFLEEEAPRLEKWLRQGYQGEMRYLEEWFDKRLDPRKLLPGTRTVISLMHNYYTDKLPEDKAAPKIARYAYGKDYHRVVRKKLQTLLEFIRERVGDIQGRGFTDSAPILERAWATRAGLGWIGKNGMLIRRKAGSYFLLAELLVDCELDYDAPESRDLCGKCRLCIDACPTGAILEGRVLDARRCISYLTIEYHGGLPLEFTGKLENRVFGCDICQEVCPHNRWSRQHEEPTFEPHPELLRLTIEQWRELDQQTYERLFAGRAVKRATFAGLRRTLDFLGLRATNERD